MADISCEWPFPDVGIGSLLIGPDGDVLMCDGETEARQRVGRRVLSNPRQVLSDGTTLPPDLIFDGQYGVGARRLIGSATNAAKIDTLKQQIRDGMVADELVSTNPPPDVLIQSGQNGNLFLVGIFVPTTTGKPTATPRLPLT